MAASLVVSVVSGVSLGSSGAAPHRSPLYQRPALELGLVTPAFVETADAENSPPETAITCYNSTLPNRRCPQSSVHSTMIMRDVVFVTLLAAIPTIIGLLGIWLLASSRVSIADSGQPRSARPKSRAGTLLIVCSSLLFLLLLIFWRLAVEHDRIGGALLVCGLGCLPLGFARGLRARGKIRLYVVLSSWLLLVPWIAAAGLLLKATMD